MPRRLVEIYHPGDRVEILFVAEEESAWRPARVVALQHPGVWAETADGRRWFVTNGRHIRPATHGEPVA